MKMSNCACCDNETTLSNSHAIPNSSFRRLFRKDSGKAFISENNEEPLRPTNDSGATIMLCGECEKLFNINYDQPAQTILQKFKSNKITDIAKCENDFLAGFILSVIWRSSVSASKLYQAFSLDEATAEAIKLTLRHVNFEEMWNIASFRILRGNDKIIDFQDVILIPSYAYISERLEIYFAMDGFILSVIFPSLRVTQLGKNGKIRRTKSFSPPKIEISTHPIFDAFVRAHQQVN